MLTLLLVLLPALPFQAQAQARTGVRSLTACGHPMYPPLSWNEDGQLTGIAPHLARLIFGELGYRLDLRVFGNWERCQLEARQGRVDVIVAAYKTRQRERLFQFSETPIIADPVVLFVRADRNSEPEPSPDWSGKTLGLLFGDSFGDQFDQALARHPDVERVSTGEQNVGKLALGRIDYMPIGLSTGRLQAQRLHLEEQIRPLPSIISVEYYHLALPNGSALLPLLPAISERLRQLTEDHYISQITPYYEQRYLALTDAP
jgi:polar amino acid transport system substrate-binding protein